MADREPYRRTDHTDPLFPDGRPECINRDGRPTYLGGLCGPCSGFDDSDRSKAAHAENARAIVIAVNLVDSLMRVAEAARDIVAHLDGPDPRHGLWETLKADRDAVRAALADLDTSVAPERSEP